MIKIKMTYAEKIPYLIISLFRFNLSALCHKRQSATKPSLDCGFQKKIAVRHVAGNSSERPATRPVKN